MKSIPALALLLTLAGAGPALAHEPAPARHVVVAVPAHPHGVIRHRWRGAAVHRHWHRHGHRAHWRHRHHRRHRQD